MSIPDGRLGVYVHFPYCTRRCPYCDFNVTVRPVEHERYRDAVLAELAVRSTDFAGRRPALSVYFGGGTPGLWRPDCIEAVIEGVRQHLGLAQAAEVTVECNPEDVTREHLAGLRAAGVTRISLGTQSFDDAQLLRLGRQHDAATNRRAVEAVHAVGFPGLSLDLIYGGFGQSRAQALADVAAAAALAPTHLSAYQLTIESGTPFGARAARGEALTGPDDDLADLFEAVREAAGAAGYLPYEISNFARPGHEAVHNSLYWTFAEYVALGAGAHGFRKRSDGTAVRWENARPLARYLAGALAGTPAEQSSDVIDADTLLEERLFTGLRLEAGLPIDGALEARFGAAARRQAEAGLLVCSPTHWRTTPRGRLLLNRVVLAMVDAPG
jgi:putative oxygen-independent coproporphyrinogen III oxidase